MPYLTVELNEQQVISRELSGTLVVGRSANCGLRLASPLLSRKHLRFEETPQGWEAVDLSSTNGTWFRGQRISRLLLQNGDVIQLNEVTLRFSSNRPAPESEEDVPADQDQDPAVDVERHVTLREEDIDAILDRPHTDSVDEEPGELDLSLPADLTDATSEVQSSPLADPAEDLGLRFGQAASLWEIAMKPPTPSPHERDPRAVRPNPLEGTSSPAPGERLKWGAVVLRFESDPKFKAAVTFSAIALLGLGGFFWLGANGFIATAMPAGPASSAAHVQAPASASNGNALADQPV